MESNRGTTKKAYHRYWTVSRRYQGGIWRYRTVSDGITAISGGIGRYHGGIWRQYHPSASPLRAGHCDPVEAVSQVVFVAMVTHRAQVVVGAVGALPANTEYRLLAARVAYRALVLGACGGGMCHRWCPHVWCLWRGAGVTDGAIRFDACGGGMCHRWCPRVWCLFRGHVSQMVPSSLVPVEGGMYHRWCPRVWCLFRGDVSQMVPSSLVLVEGGCVTGGALVFGACLGGRGGQCRDTTTQVFHRQCCRHALATARGQNLPLPERTELPREA